MRWPSPGATRHLCLFQRSGWKCFVLIFRRLSVLARKENWINFHSNSMSRAHLFIDIPRAMCVMLTIRGAKTFRQFPLEASPLNLFLFRRIYCQSTWSHLSKFLFSSFSFSSIPSLGMCLSFPRSIKDYHRKIAPEEKRAGGEKERKAFICDHLENFSTHIFIIIILSLRPSSEIIIQSVYILTWSGIWWCCVCWCVRRGGERVGICFTGIGESLCGGFRGKQWMKYWNVCLVC